MDSAMTNTAVRPISLLVAATHLVMVAINGLANALPIKRHPNRGKCRRLPPNLFVSWLATRSPSGGVIYLLPLAGTALPIFGLFRTDRGDTRPAGQGGPVEPTISSLANAAWILALALRPDGLSVLLMLVILGSLAVIVQTIRAASPSTREKWLVAVPFSVYFGWITVATVANVTVFLVSSAGAGRIGLAESTGPSSSWRWPRQSGTAAMLRNRDLAYGGGAAVGVHRDPRQTPVRGGLRRRLPAGHRHGCGVPAGLLLAAGIILVGGDVGWSHPSGDLSGAAPVSFPPAEVRSTWEF